VLPDQWMSDVYSCLVLQTVRCAAAGVDGELLSTTAQESNAAPVADAHKKVQVQDKSFGAGEEPAAATVLIAQLDFVRSPADDLAQPLTLKEHVAWIFLWCLLSR
jgi:hypothetical protein